MSHFVDSPCTIVPQLVAHREQCYLSSTDESSFWWKLDCSLSSSLLWVEGGIVCVLTTFVYDVLIWEVLNLWISFQLYWNGVVRQLRVFSCFLTFNTNVYSFMAMHFNWSSFLLYASFKLTKREANALKRPSQLGLLHLRVVCFVSPVQFPKTTGVVMKRLVLLRNAICGIHLH